jgi:hypothetical protein
MFINKDLDLIQLNVDEKDQIGQLTFINSPYQFDVPNIIQTACSLARLDGASVGIFNILCSHVWQGMKLETLVTPIHSEFHGYYFSDDSSNIACNP